MRYVYITVACVSYQEIMRKIIKRFNLNAQLKISSIVMSRLLLMTIGLFITNAKTH